MFISICFVVERNALTDDILFQTADEMKLGFSIPHSFAISLVAVFLTKIEKPSLLDKFSLVTSEAFHPEF